MDNSNNDMKVYSWNGSRMYEVCGDKVENKCSCLFYSISRLLNVAMPEELTNIVMGL